MYQHPQKHRLHQPHGPRHNRGKVYRDKLYRYWCYDRHWRGYTRKIWYRPLKTYVYWCPDQKCWYRWDGIAFYPVETLRDPDLGYK